jgi:hypothetical protein
MCWNIYAQNLKGPLDFVVVINKYYIEFFVHLPAS